MTNDPTITIAGLRAQIDSLETSLRSSLDDGATSEEARLIAAADLAGLTAERDALAAKLAEGRAELARARHAGTDLGVALEELRSERAHLAACQARIAGLEQAADERSKEVTRPSEQVASARQLIDEERAAGWETVKAENQRAIDAEAEVARLTNERSEWIHAAVSIGEHVDHLGPVAIGAGEINQREWIHYAHSLAGRVKARIGALTARVAELEARPVLTREALCLAITSKRTTIEGPQIGTDATIFAQLTEGGPVTLPTAQDQADELAAARWAAWRDEAGDTPTTPWDDLRDHRRDSEVRIMKRALRVVGAPPTSPPAARPVFAGVSVEELIDTYAKAYSAAYDERIKAIRDSGERPAQMPSRPEIAIRAVLARLEVSLVAPVDPRNAARSFADASDDKYGMPWHRLSPEWRDAYEQRMRATLTAAGIPVTPERGK